MSLRNFEINLKNAKIYNGFHSDVDSNVLNLVNNKKFLGKCDPRSQKTHKCHFEINLDQVNTSSPPC